MKAAPQKPQKKPKANAAKRRPLVGIAFTQGLAFLEKARRGIVDYANEHGGWTFLFMPEIIGSMVGWLRHTQVDGAFTLVLSPKDRQLARSCAFPVVSLSGHIAPRATPTVIIDDRGVGRMAAGHLFDLGFKQLGFYGSDTWYSSERHAGFAAAARQAGVACKSLLVSMASSPPDQQRQLEDWLRDLPKPVGILASIDMRAAMIVNTCAQIGLRVPDDVAVMGVDNDQFVCEQAPVSLTSIVRDDWKTGWEAAAMLDRLMSGKPIEENPVLIEPVRVESRASTRTLPVSDPFLASLVAEARARIGEPFGVEWFLEHGKCSRRWLETRFRAELGLTPLAVINRLRLGKARDLLVEPESERLRLSDIARQCGFPSQQRFRIVFRKHTGMTPRQFRREHQHAPGIAIK